MAGPAAGLPHARGVFLLLQNLVLCEDSSSNICMNQTLHHLFSKGGTGEGLKPHLFFFLLAGQGGEGCAPARCPAGEDRGAGSRPHTSTLPSSNLQGEQPSYQHNWPQSTWGDQRSPCLFGHSHSLRSPPTSAHPQARVSNFAVETPKFIHRKVHNT